MPFVAMVKIRFNSQGLQQADPSHSQQQFLLEPVFKISSIKMVGYTPVLFNILLKICIHQV